MKSTIISTYKVSENKITVINRGVDTKFFDSTIYNDDNNFINFLNKYHLSNEKKIILYPGRLTKWKGQINFLKIMESYQG